MSNAGSSAPHVSYFIVFYATIKSDMIFDRTIMRQIYKASIVGLNIVIATVVGGFLGYLFDSAMEKWFGVKTAPWGLFIGALFGIVSGFKDLFMLAKKIDQDSSKKNNDSSEKDL